MMPRKIYSSLDKLCLGNLVLALEADLDSIQLQLQPRYASKQPFPRNIEKVRMQIRRCLAIARRLQSRFPQKDYTLNRCGYKDELPGQPMSEAKKDWYSHKKKERELKTQAKLVEVTDKHRDKKQVRNKNESDV